jgi:hypothetical protein
VTSEPVPAGAPRPSVVIASFRHPETLFRSVDSLEAQCRALGAELIIARAGDADDLARVRARVPWATVLAAPPGSKIPYLRGLGIGAATGNPVAVTEDHCLAAPDWLGRMVDQISPDCDFAGGGMANLPGSSMIEWAAYLADYGFYSFARPPAVAGAPPLITAANVVYSRRVAPEVAAWAIAGAWEDVAHNRLAEQGRGYRFVPEAKVFHSHHYTFSAFWRDRFSHGYDYGRARLAEPPHPHRLYLLAITPLLPLVLGARIARSASGEDRWAFLRALPIMLAFLSGWSAGEVAGYLAGADPAIRKRATS